MLKSILGGSLFFISLSANAVVYNFEQVNNNQNNTSVGDQIQVDITESLSFGDVQFSFTNPVGVGDPSSIIGVFVDTGSILSLTPDEAGLVDGFTQVNGPNFTPVNSVQSQTGIGSLISIETINQGGGNLTNGIDASGESVNVFANYIGQTSFSDVISQVNAGTLGVGLTVNVGNQGGSDEYRISVSAVPEPETYAMFLAGLGLLAAHKRKKH